MDDASNKFAPELVSAAPPEAGTAARASPIVQAIRVMDLPRREWRDAANHVSVRPAGRAQAIPALHALARREGPALALEGPSGSKGGRS